MSTKNEHAVALGRLGGRKGGLARKRALTSKRRKEIARWAARVRWDRRSKMSNIVKVVVRVDGSGDKSR